MTSIFSHMNSRYDKPLTNWDISNVKNLNHANFRCSNDFVKNYEMINWKLNDEIFKNMYPRSSISTYDQFIEMFWDNDNKMMGKLNVQYNKNYPNG